MDTIESNKMIRKENSFSERIEYYQKHTHEPNFYHEYKSRELKSSMNPHESTYMRRTSRSTEALQKASTPVIIVKKVPNFKLLQSRSAKSVKEFIESKKIPKDK